ncbi:MAG: PAS domain S-box protein [Chamaesiphon sp.]|nr:PAS domain S-box protein [Chamaesiphon sp.]
MLPTLTLLIVEDVQAPRYQDYLVGDSKYDYCLLTAGSAADGLELCNTQAIDAILLDYSLLDGDGLTFLGGIHQSNNSNPPVVIVLGESDVTIAVKAIKLGAQDYLAKCDLTPELLQLTIHSAIENARRYFRDISDRKCLEIQRIQAEQDRDRFFNLSLDLLAIANFEGYLLRLNPAWEEILGFSAAELMGQPYLDLVHPEDRATTLAAAQGLSAGQVSIEFENRYRCKDGSYRWLSWSATPYIDRNLIYAIAHDITERKQAEAALRESERKFGAIFDQTFELIGILSVDGVLLEVNQSALDSIGAQASEIVGKRFWETPWWNSAQIQYQAKESIDRVISGQLIRYEVQFTSASGDLRTTDFSLKPIFDDGGRVTMIIAEARDITERKQAEAALEDRVRELDRVNSLLAESAALLQERNQELDSFVYIVSHDLKAPLRGISNLSQWIEDDFDGSLDPNAQQQMALLRSRVRRMEAMIDGLLDYARIGRMEVKIDRVVVTELLAETLDSLGYPNESRIAPPPTFEIVIAPDLPTLYTKRLLLLQVFTNLIGNGIKHHHRADGSIHVSGRDLGNLYEFAIADDGPGINPDHHQKIFMIFQAVNPQNRADSTGIGLSIVKKIVDTEGGTIRLESEIGKGTTFYFNWPKQL